MAQQMLVEKLHRLTLVRKGRAVAKHPDMRDGVLEVVKSETESLGEDEVLSQTDSLDTSSYDWYEDFAQFIIDCSDDEIPDDGWEAAYAGYKESAAGKKKKNYPDGAGPFAGPHNSFPISSQHHVYAAARLLGHAANPAQVKANIIRIAHEKGYSLPKSWQKKTKKAEDFTLKAEAVDQAIATLRQALLGVETPVETPEVIETPLGEVPVTEEAEKAKTPPHSHSHSHVTTYGYGYSHEHPHGDSEHADADDHGTSETMHAHEHVAKAGDSEMDGLLADNAGLKQDLDAVHVQMEALKAQLATLQEAKAVAENKQASAEVKAQELYKNLLRRPLTAPTQDVEKSVTPITPDMSMDEAFAIAMGRK